MDRRKNSNDNNMNHSSHSHHSHNSKIRFEDPEEEEEETTQGSNNLNESMCDPECSDKAIDGPNDVSFMDGDDKTSADYYFDSSSHFAIEDAEYKDDKIEFWNNIYGFDMSCIKKQALMEPLVDTVDQNQIVTNCQLLKTMDISRMAPGDASFTAPFKLGAERDDYIHALVA